MREVFATAADLLKNSAPCALATLVHAFDSAPAPIGTTIAVADGDRIFGNIGAGCYEPDIVQACRLTIADGEVRMLDIDLSVADEVTRTPGCGGKLGVAVWKPERSFELEAREIVRGARDVTVTLANGSVFTIPAKRRLVMVGATALAQAIAQFAHMLEFYVTVIDPRTSFATAERLSSVDEVITVWPDDYLPLALQQAAALLVISHDHKLDVPALRCALESQVPYIGLLGSRRTQTARRDALRELGVPEPALARIHGPAGLDLGGETTAETALSMLAHIVADANRRSGTPIEGISGPIHSSTAAVSTSK
jgi:xanthine dehydrogenase accessory factor